MHEIKKKVTLSKQKFIKIKVKNLMANKCYKILSTGTSMSTQIGAADCPSGIYRNLHAS
jgi:hypothetical protein